MAVRVSNADFEEKVLKEKLTVLVDFIQIPVWHVKAGTGSRKCGR